MLCSPRFYLRRLPGACILQGVDFYVAGCAPTIIAVTLPLPLQVPPPSRRGPACPALPTQLALFFSFSLFFGVTTACPFCLVAVALRAGAAAQASWAYSRNARNNHMPLTTITYSQL